MFDDNNYINVSENSDGSLKRRTFYENKSVTKELKGVFDELRKIYPTAKNYDDLMSNVLFEFDYIFRRFSKDRDYRKFRERWFKVGFLHIDFSEKPGERIVSAGKRKRKYTGAANW
jgi:hypothetical protein